MTNFLEKYKTLSQKNDSLVCVGLDSEVSKLPNQSSVSVLDFNKAIIDATKDLVCAYKPNCAFYEAIGIDGYSALKETIEYIPNEIPVILDAKRGDIGNTSRQYAISCFDDLKADAVTLSPYMGFDTIEPFLDYADKTVFMLVKTSNQSSGDFQDLKLENGKKLFIQVAETIAKWQENSKSTIGIVVGATYPEDLREIRKVLPSAPILLPGLGKQGGDTEKSVKYGEGQGKAPLIVNSSRGIIFASNGADFANASREAAVLFKDNLNSYRN